MSVTIGWVTRLRAAGAAPVVGVVLLGSVAGCSGVSATNTAPSGGSATGSSGASTSTGGTVSSPTHSGSDDTPTRVPSQTSSPGECAPTSISAGPAGHLVTLVVSAPLSAAAGSTLTADTTIVVHSSGPRVVLQPGSRLEVLRAGAVVARSAAAGGAVIPLPLTAGRTLPAQTVPTTVQLVGCNGVALTAGEYQVRAVLAYGNDPLNSAAAGAVGNFELVSETVTVTVT